MKHIKFITATTLMSLLLVGAGVAQAVSVPWQRPSVGEIHPQYVTDQVSIGTSTTPTALTSFVVSATSTDTTALGRWIDSTGTEVFTWLTSGLFGIGSTTPGTELSIGTSNGINLSSTATSTFNGTGGGINIASGCFAISGTCLSAGGGGGTPIGS